jgi:hypothetical protein
MIMRQLFTAALLDPPTILDCQQTSVSSLMQIWIQLCKKKKKILSCPPIFFLLELHFSASNCSKEEASMQT